MLVLKKLLPTAVFLFHDVGSAPSDATMLKSVFVPLSIPLGLGFRVELARRKGEIDPLRDTWNRLYLLLQGRHVQGDVEEPSPDSGRTFTDISGTWLQALLLGVLMKRTLYPPIVAGMFATQLSS